MNRVKEFFKNNIKVPYYFVPKCPSCGSYCTGRYVKNHRATENDWMVKESLKNGELIKPIPEILDKTTFCIKCGFEWKGAVTKYYLSLNEIEKQKVIRNTNNILQKKIEEQKEYEKTHRKTLISRYIGKL